MDLIVIKGTVTLFSLKRYSFLPPPPSLFDTYISKRESILFQKLLHSSVNMGFHFTVSITVLSHNSVGKPYTCSSQGAYLQEHRHRRRTKDLQEGPEQYT